MSKKIRFAILLSFLWATSAWGALLLLDNFERVDSPDLGPDWTISGASRQCQIFGGKVLPTTPGSQCSEVRTLTAYSGTGPQTASVTLSTLSASSSAGVLVRGSGGGVMTFYACAAGIGAVATDITKRVDGIKYTLTPNDTVTTWVNDDLLTCDISGTTTVTIIVKRNGTPVLTVTDDGTGPSGAALSGQYIGVTAYAPGSNTDTEIDDFSTDAPAANKRVIVVVQ